MRTKIHKFAWLPALAVLFVSPSVVGSNIERDSLQNPASPPTKTTAYFPPGAVDGFSDYLSGYLRSIGEPSLFSAAQDHGLASYRLDWLSGQRGYLLAVRLSLNPDGTGTVAATEQFDARTAPTRTQRDISNADVKKFLQLVEKAGFWSMRTHDPDKPDMARKSYKLDASTCILEGVSNGSYHIVFRRGPEAGPFADMVRFLAKDLPNLDQAAFPDTFPPPPSDPANVSDQHRPRD